MQRTVLKYGLIAGLIVSVLMCLTMPFESRIPGSVALLLGYAGMVAAFFFVFIGIRTYRDTTGGGTVRFGRAFAVGALIVLVAGAMYTATWEVIYYGFQPDFIERYQARQLEAARAKGATEAELAKQRAEGAQMAASYHNPAVNVAYTMAEVVPPGLVIALVSAGVLSRRRRRAGVEAALA